MERKGKREEGRNVAETQLLTLPLASIFKKMSAVIPRRNSFYVIST